MTVVSEVSAEVVTRRVKRHLSKRGLGLKEARPASDKPWRRDEDCHRWNLIDVATNRVILANLDLEHFARALGVLNYWEVCPEFPSAGPGF